jgi:hypothetical protein
MSNNPSLNIKNVKYSDDDAKLGADIALKNRLYVSGWELSKFLQKVRGGVVDADVLIAFNDDTPVSVVVVEKRRLYAQAFTRKSMRKRGIAKTLIKECGAKIKSTGIGIDGSSVFWSKVISSN